MQENQEIRSTLFKKSLDKNVSIEFIDVIETFCTADGCMVYIGDDVKTGITYYDSHHLSPTASDYLAKEKLIQSIWRAGWQMNHPVSMLNELVFFMSS
jgi:hypothetical protein